MRFSFLPSVALVLVACGGSGSARHVIPQEAGADGGTTGSGGSGGSGGSPSTGGSAGKGGGGASSGGATSLDAGAGGSGVDASTDSGPQPNPLDRWIDPVNGLDTNDGTSASTPLKNLFAALAATASGGTLWLMDGTYDSTTGQTPPTGGPNQLTIADGVSVRAVHAGAVSVTPSPFVLSGSGTVSGVHFVRTPRAVVASAGTVHLDGVTFADAGGGCAAGDRAVLDLIGTADVTLTPGTEADYVAQGTRVVSFAFVADTAHLTVSGGTFRNLGRGSCSPGSNFTLTGSAKLTLNGVTVKDSAAQYRGGLISLRSATAEVELTDTMIDGTVPGANANGAAIYIDGTGSPKVTLTRTTIQNLPEVGAIAVGYEYAPNTPDITITDSAFKNNAAAIWASGIYAGTPNLTITNTELSGSTVAALYLNAGGTVTMTGGKVQGCGNGGYYNGVAGINLAGAYPYTVKFRNVTVSGNPTSGSVPAILLGGDATSVFDFGKVGDAGGNFFSGNLNTGVKVQVSAGVTVYAVGNTWNPSLQSASAAGLYSVTGAGAKMDVTSGSGKNYLMQTGTLRLAENP